MTLKWCVMEFNIGSYGVFKAGLQKDFLRCESHKDQNSTLAFVFSALTSAERQIYFSF